MMLIIPKELRHYVRMSKKDGLVHDADMPVELMPLFEETKKKVILAEKNRRDELEKLILKM